MRAIAQVELVLHAHDVDNLPRLVDLVRLDLAQPDVPNLAFLLHLLDRAQRLLDRDLRVNAVQLPEIDALGLQQAQAHLYLLRQILRAPHREPLVRPLPRQSTLGSNNQAVLVGGKHLPNLALIDIGTVGVCGVDKIHAKFHGLLQNFLCPVGILWLAPHAFANQAHGTESEAIHFQVSTKLECFRYCRLCLICHKSFDVSRPCRVLTTNELGRCPRVRRARQQRPAAWFRLRAARAHARRFHVARPRPPGV